MNQVVVLGFVVAAFLVGTHVASFACASLARRLPSRWAHQPRLRAGLALLPIVVGVGVSLSMLQPGVTGAGCHCMSHPHHPHMCLEHAAFSWVLALGCVIAIPWTVGVVRHLLEVARAAVETTRWASSLDDVRTERAGEVEVRVSPSVGPRAFTVGAWRSAIVVGSELWAQLEPDARRALALHERAHAVRRDALTLLCLRIAGCAMPAGAAAELLAGWRRSAEETCDRLAAEWHGDPLAVAAALVACGRLQAGSAVPTGALVVGATHGDDLEARVLTLLEPRPNAQARAASDLVLPTLALGLGLVAFLGLFGDVPHHAVETILGLIA